MGAEKMYLRIKAPQKCGGEILELIREDINLEDSEVNVTSKEGEVIIEAIWYDREAQGPIANSLVSELRDCENLYIEGDLDIAHDEYTNGTTKVRLIKTPHIRIAFFETWSIDIQSPFIYWEVEQIKMPVLMGRINPEVSEEEVRATLSKLLEGTDYSISSIHKGPSGFVVVLSKRKIDTSRWGQPLSVRFVIPMNDEE